MKIKSLEGLRGLAAYSVVLFHFFGIFYPAFVNGTPFQVHTSNGIELLFATTPLNFWYNGNFAVCIFFTLSGFVLSHKYFKTNDSSVITSSAIRRYFRLMIPVLFSVICFYIAYNFKSPYAPNTIQNFSFFNALKEGLYGAYFQVSNAYNPVLWTMHFELFGSFMVFGFCLLFGNIRNRWVLYLISSLLLWNTSYFAFILGMMLSDAFVHWNPKVKSISIKIILLMIAIFLGAYPNKLGIVPGSITVDQTIYRFIHFTSVPYVFYQNIGSAILLFVLMVSTRMTSALSKPFIQFLGKVSFSLYLTHPLVVSFFAIWFFNTLPSNLAHKYLFIITFAVSNVLIFIFSYFMEKYVDAQAVRFAKYIDKNIFNIIQDQRPILRPLHPLERSATHGDSQTK